jgi:glycosyl transferase, family 25
MSAPLPAHPNANKEHLDLSRLHTWVINLDRAPDRLARIAQQLQALQLPFTRLPAVDARALTAEQHAALDEPAYRRKHGMAPMLGELGCYLSHLQAMHLFLASNATYALVLEDDVLLHTSLPGVLRGLMNNPIRWDVAKLSAVHSGTPVPYLQVAPGHQLAVMLSRCTGSSAYLMNRQAAAVYAQQLLPMTLPYDHVFDRGWALGLRYRLVTPTPCGHDEEIASTIVAPPGVTRKFHWTRRLGAYRYRLGNECQRLAYGLRETLREQFTR